MFLRLPLNEVERSVTNAAHIRNLVRDSSLPQDNAGNRAEHRPPNPCSDEEAFAKRVLSKCADGDIPAALRLLTSEDTIAVDSADTLRGRCRRNIHRAPITPTSPRPPAHFLAMPCKQTMTVCLLGSGA